MSKQYCSAYYIILRASEKKWFDCQRTKQKKSSWNKTLWITTPVFHNISNCNYFQVFFSFFIWDLRFLKTCTRQLAVGCKYVVLFGVFIHNGVCSKERKIQMICRNLRPGFVPSIVRKFENLNAWRIFGVCFFWGFFVCLFSLKNIKKIFLENDWTGIQGPVWHTNSDLNKWRMKS